MARPPPYLKTYFQDDFDEAKTALVLVRSTEWMKRGRGEGKLECSLFGVPRGTSAYEFGQWAKWKYGALLRSIHWLPELPD